MSDTDHKLSPGVRLVLSLDGLPPSEVTLVKRLRSALTLRPVTGAARETAATATLPCGAILRGHASQTGPLDAIFRLAGDVPRARPAVPRDRAPRLVAGGAAVFIVRADGTRVAGALIDLSSSGFGVSMDKLLRVGDVVRIGDVKAQAVRMTAEGYGFQILWEGGAVTEETLVRRLTAIPSDLRSGAGLAPRRLGGGPE